MTIQNCPEPAGNFDITYNGGITITWEAVKGADSYGISRAGSRLGIYTHLATVTDTSYTDIAPNQDKYENYYRVTAKNDAGILWEGVISLEIKMFGKNALFYDSKYDAMPLIQNDVNRIHDTEMFGGITGEDGRAAEFSSKRYALYFKQGAYRGLGPLKIGFYTHAAGLGKVPAETKIFGSIETPPHLHDNNATCTFWRSIENMEIAGPGTFHWAVSQAAPVRRMKAGVPAEFDWGGWSSGGYTGDSSFSAEAGSRTQQQWYARNCHFAKGFYGVNWNKVAQGCTGEVDSDNWAVGGCATKIDKTPVIREKPFLYLENNEYKVFVPGIKNDSQGTSWTDSDMGSGFSLDLERDFYIAKEGSGADAINAALEQGKHIFFTPGRYELDAPIHIKSPGAVVLGTGLATLIPGPVNAAGALYIEDVDNVTVAGLMFDALYSSTYLLCAGGKGANKDHSAAPTLLADLFFRIGGYRQENVHVDVAALINSSDIIGDHFWVWRADHGQGIGWDRNTSKNGVIVTGNRVTFYGLFVEHFQEYQTLWTGDCGRTYFYQNESPYDPFSQSLYKSHHGKTDGWAAYKVANNVDNHFAVGLGVYAVFNRTGPDRKKSAPMFIDNAIEVPNKPGVEVKHACILDLSGTGGVPTGIRSIVNGTGPASENVKRQYLVSYKNGVETEDEDFVIPRAAP